MLDTADVTKKFIETIIEIIGRKTSKDYAAVTIGNVLRKLQRTYPFLHAIEINNTRSLELESVVAAQDSLNTVNPTKVGAALKDLMSVLMISLGKNAGYFFLRETREKIGIAYDTILLKTMDVDLTLMQSTYIVEKKSIDFLDIQDSDVLRRFIKALIDVVEKQTSRTFALSFIAQHVHALQERYSFLQYISINDIRYTFGSEEIAVQKEINNIDKVSLGRAIRAILENTEKTLADLGRNSIANDLKLQLTMDYLAKLREMDVTITPFNIGYNAVFYEVIKTLIAIIGKTTSANDAIVAVNSHLRKIDGKYEFLKYVKVEPAANQDDMFHLEISQNIDTISETDARRAIQQLLEGIMVSFGEKIGDDFISQFKESLDKKFLMKIEEMGVNFHMIELHHELFGK